MTGDSSQFLGEEIAVDNMNEIMNARGVHENNQ